LQQRSDVSDEELQALLPHLELSKGAYDRVRHRISLRFTVMLVRIIVSLFFPEYHYVAVVEHELLNKVVADRVLYSRLIFLSLGVILYFYCFRYNRYFRSVNVAALVVISCLIAADIEVYILGGMQYFTWQTGVLALLRFVALGLIFLNYLDVRQ
jgi:hypothetical protein